MPARGIVAALLALLTVAVYASVREHEFLNYDDRVYVLENPMLRSGSLLESAARAFHTPYEASWIPLTWISLRLDRELHGFEPAGYLATNVALHAASAVVLFLVLAELSGARGRSAFVAAVFAAHPLHVESVAWISERKDVLSGFCFALLLAAHAWHARRPSWRRQALVVLLLALGLLAKPMLVTAPAVLLLLDFWPLGRLADPASRRRALLEKLPLALLAAAVAAATLVLQGAARAVLPADALPLSLRLANALDATVWYVEKSFWPSGLAAFYPLDPAGLGPARVLACAVLLAAASAGSLLAARRRPHLAVGWLWFLVMLAPVVGVVQVGLQARADRYAYLPQIGLCLAVAWEAAALAGRLRIPPTALRAVACALVAVLALLASRQVATWRDTRTLFERALRVTGENFYAQSALGGVALEAGRHAEAERHYREAIRLQPTWAPPHLGLAFARWRRGDPAAALTHYRAGLALDPEHGGGHAQLAALLLHLGRPGEALRHFERALALGHDSAEARAGLAAARRRAKPP